MQATSEEILTIIRSLIHFVVKYPEISDQAMNILKQMTKSTHQNKQIDILYLCFKECLSLMQMKIYETHTIIFILNSFSISSDDLQYKTILFLINSLFFEVFMKGVARVEESPTWSSHVHDHQLKLDPSLLEQIYFNEQSKQNSLDQTLINQLITIIKVLQSESQIKLPQHIQLMKQLSTSVVKNMNDQVVSELSLDVDVPTDETLKISNFIGELAVRTHGSSKALVPYRACLFSALHSLLNAKLLTMSFSSAAQLALRCQELVSDYKICSDSV